MKDMMLELATTLEQQRAQAMMKGDAATLEILLSADMSYGHSGGHVEGKVAYLENMAIGNYVYHLVKTEIDQVTPIGDVGFVIRGKVVNELTLFGKEVQLHAVYLAVWRLEAGVWRFLSHQTALVK